MVIIVLQPRMLLLNTFGLVLFLFLVHSAMVDGQPSSSGSLKAIHNRSETEEKTDEPMEVDDEEEDYEEEDEEVDEEAEEVEAEAGEKESSPPPSPPPQPQQQEQQNIKTSSEKPSSQDSKRKSINASSLVLGQQAADTNITTTTIASSDIAGSSSSAIPSAPGKPGGRAQKIASSFKGARQKFNQMMEGIREKMDISVDWIKGKGKKGKDYYDDQSTGMKRTILGVGSFSALTLVGLVGWGLYAAVASNGDEGKDMKGIHAANETKVSDWLTQLGSLRIPLMLGVMVLLLLAILLYYYLSRDDSSGRPGAVTMGPDGPSQDTNNQGTVEASTRPLPGPSTLNTTNAANNDQEPSIHMHRQSLENWMQRMMEYARKAPAQAGKRLMSAVYPLSTKQNLSPPGTSSPLPPSPSPTPAQYEASTSMVRPGQYGSRFNFKAPPPPQEVMYPGQQRRYAAPPDYPAPPPPPPPPPPPGRSPVRYSDSGQVGPSYSQTNKMMMVSGKYAFPPVPPPPQYPPPPPPPGQYPPAAPGTNPYRQPPQPQQRW